MAEQNNTDQVPQDSNGPESDRSASPSVENDSFLFFSYLDELDDRIEYLRRHAIALSQERDSLLLVLSQLKEESMTGSLTQDEFQEICVSMDRLRTRCQTVDIKVKTIRNAEQEEAFTKVHTLVDDLEKSCSVSDKKNEALKRAKSCLNACLSDVIDGGAIDFKFQGMILDCVIEDQKYIRGRLENVVRNGVTSSRYSTKSHLFERGGASVTESCLKPSDIATAVKESPDYDDFDDSFTDVPGASDHNHQNNDFTGSDNVLKADLNCDSESSHPSSYNTSEPNEKSCESSSSSQFPTHQER